MESTIRLKDKLWDLFEIFERDQPIYEISHSHDVQKWIPPSMPVSERSYIDVFLRMDDSMRLYKREEYDVLTYLGDLGGLSEILILLGWFVSKNIVSRLYSAALVKESYRV